MQDGRWEVGGALAAEVGEVDGGEREREVALVRSMREALRSSVQELGGVKEVRCMDVWWGSFRAE